MVEAVIFDLDGTLLDTRDDLANSINLMLKDLNKNKMSKEEVISHVGHGIKNLVEACSNPKDDIERRKSLELFKKHYDREYSHMTSPYQGMIELVDEINELGIKVGVNSNKDDIYTKELIKKHYKSINLQYVLGNKDNIERKPSPQGIEIILDSMGKTKDTTIYIGDSKVDIETAKNAGVECISVGWGFSKKEELLKENNIRLVESPDEILKYIKEKNHA